MKQMEKLKNFYFYNLMHKKYKKNIGRKISSYKKKKCCILDYNIY